MSCPRRFLLALALFVVVAVPGPALAENPPAAQADAHAGHELPPPPAVEQPVDHAAHGPAATEPAPAAAGHDHGQPAVADQVAPPAAADQAAPAQAGGHQGHAMGTMPGMEEMQRRDEAMAARMRELQAQMDAIAASTDPAERKRLLAAHLDGLTRAIGLLREMDGQMMQSMMQDGKCPMMAMMAAPQGHAGMQNMMGHMSMCRSMMQKKAAHQYALLELIVAAQKALLTALP